MNSKNRALALLSFYTVILIILQLARMGVLSNPTQYSNAAGMEAKPVSSFVPDVKSPLKGLVVYDEASSASQMCAENYRRLFEQYSIPFDVQTTKETQPIDQSVNCVIFAVSDFTAYLNFDDLMRYIQAGGAVIFAAKPEYNAMYLSQSNFLGITESSDGKTSDTIVDVKGVVGEAGARYLYKGKVAYALSVRLRGECEVYLTDENGMPLLWKTRQGSGTIFASVSDVIEVPTGRGVVSEILYEIAGKSLMVPNYSVVTTTLESFPGPSISGKYLIFSETHKSYDRFIKDILWTDMMKLAKQYGLKYTISYVQSYDIDTSAPFGNGELLSTSLMTYGTEVLRHGGEIAFHGYNYRPLGLKGELSDSGWFLPWASMRDIGEALADSVEFFKGSYPNYTLKTYYPPEGRISESVLKQIKEMVPGLETICFPYRSNLDGKLFGDFQTGENGLYYFATTSGIEGALWDAQNSLYSLGIVSQSIDIPYAVVVNNLSWSSVLSDLKAIYSSAFQRMPTLKPMSVSGAVSVLKLYEKMKYAYEETESGIDVWIDQYFDGSAFLLRTGHKLISGDGYTSYACGENVYTVLPASPRFTIHWEA